MPETVTVTCTRHRRRCTLAKGGIEIRHEGPGAFGSALCDSQQFTVRREQQISRGGAHAELIRLDCIAQAQAVLDRAPENESAAAAATRED
jgi:hypothetical protein